MIRAAGSGRQYWRMVDASTMFMAASRRLCSVGESYKPFLKGGMLACLPTFSRSFTTTFGRESPSPESCSRTTYMVKPQGLGQQYASLVNVSLVAAFMYHNMARLYILNNKPFESDPNMENTPRMTQEEIDVSSATSNHNYMGCINLIVTSANRSPFFGGCAEQLCATATRFQ